MHQCSLNAQQFAHSPKLPKSEAVAPRYTWETGTTAQSPSQCSSGKLRIRPSQVHPAVPGKARHSFPYGQTIGKPIKRCVWLHVVPIRMSPWMTDDDPLIKVDNAAALSTNEATENSGTAPGSSRARPKDQPLRSLKFVTMCSRKVSQYLCVYPRTLPQGATESMQLLHRGCRNRQNSIYR